MSSFASYQTSMTDHTYQLYILQKVSRTFALTIPQLPDQLKTVVGNAYLLCRIADTIEDDKNMTAEEKKQYTDMFIGVVIGFTPADFFAEQLFLLLSETASLSELDLIANTSVVLRITHSFEKRQRNALDQCVSIMAKGMALYQDADTLEGLTDQDEMDQYCYYVAGVVGEMLTELFCHHSSDIDKQYDTLITLAVSFGQGLQMTNILKDIWEDHERGHCWLPRDLFAKHDIKLADKSADNLNRDFGIVIKQLVGVAYAHLNHAMNYTLLIPKDEVGIRRFCLWAIAMAILTLNNIHAKPNFKNGQAVKIKRYQVYTIIRLSNLFINQNKILWGLFHWLGRKLPKVSVNEKSISKKCSQYNQISCKLQP